METHITKKAGSLHLLSAARRTRNGMDVLGPTSECHSDTDSSSDHPLGQLASAGLAHRVALPVALIVCEVLATSIWLDTAALAGSHGLARLIGDWGPAAVQWAVAFAALWLTFGWRIGNSALRRLSAEAGRPPVSYTLLLGHVGILIVFAALSVVLFGKNPAHFPAGLLAGGWLTAGTLASVLAALAFLPAKLWFALLHDTRWAALYAAIGAAGASVFATASHSLWRPLGRVTFSVVAALLHPFLKHVSADPVSLTIGSSIFNVTIAPQCSGLEGVGLMLIFGTAWLWFFRDECRFPQALLLIPGGMLLTWLLNTVRIAALILVGNAGAPEIALGGFHSQAGWMAFNAVAVGFCLTLRRVPWLTRTATAPSKSPVENATAAYLGPLLAIFAAAMISGAAANGFEWLYPLRFFAAAGALWYFRRTYANLDWRFGWGAPIIGVVVLVMWLALDSVAGKHLDSGIAVGMAALNPPARIAWLSFRTLAAVVTVPIAEELAFRGFLIRRLISANFETLDLRRYTYLAVFVSAVAFGMMHGERWLAGILAGLLYAVALLRRGRIGDAVVAHATTNAVLAVWILLRGQWYLW